MQNYSLFAFKWPFVPLDTKKDMKSNTVNMLHSVREIDESISLCCVLAVVISPWKLDNCKQNKVHADVSVSSKQFLIYCYSGCYFAEVIF